MLLEQHLIKYLKDDLKFLAKELGIKKISQLNKKELACLISKKMKEEKIVIELFSCLTNDFIETYKRLCNDKFVEVEPLTIIENSLIHLNICYYDFNTKSLALFDDYKIDTSIFDSKEFKEKQKKKDWLINCLEYACFYYEMFTVEALLKLYNLKIKSNLDEMLDVYFNILLNITNTQFCSMEELGMIDWPDTYPIYSLNGLIVYCDTYYDDERIDELLRNQFDKDYYIPTRKEIEDLVHFNLDKLPQSYRKLSLYMRNALDVDERICNVLMFQYYIDTSKKDVGPEYSQDFVEEIIDKCEIKDEDILFRKAQKLMELVNDCHNDTKMVLNRGYSPNEMVAKINGPITVVPGSTHAAQLLEETSKIAQFENIKIDLEGSADYYDSILFEEDLNGKPIVKKKKIYPNDLCPCGSGLKYKQCCGKKHK